MTINAHSEKEQLGPIAWTFHSRYGQPDRPLQVAGDRLVGVYQNQVVYAVDLYSGTDIRTSGGFPYTCSDDADPQVSVSGGRAFLVDNGTLHALRLSDGTPVPGWAAPAVGSVSGVAALPDLVLVASTSPTGATLVSAFNARDGSPAWPNTQPVPNTISVGGGCTIGSIAVGVDAIFFVVQGALWAVNTRFGDVRFPAAAGSAPPAAPLSLDQTRPPLVGQNSVVCCGDAVYAFDARTGAQRWRAGGSQTGLTWSAALSSDGTRVAAVSSGGDVLLLDCETGASLYATSLPEGGTPIFAGNLIYVQAPGSRQMHAVSVDDRLKKLTSLGSLSLGEDVSDVGAALGNGLVIVPTSDGNIVSKPFAPEAAAYFSGSSAVKVASDGGWFDIGAGDFAVEAWVHSTRGGEIISAFPTGQDATACGFRFNLSADGELRFAISNGAASDTDLLKSLPTAAADGDWHHVAVVRRAGEFALFVDGLASSLASLQYRGNGLVSRNGRALNPDGTPITDRLTPPLPPAPGSIGPELTLTIGTNVSGPQAPGTDGFVGLLREVRVWDVAVDAQNLHSRMRKVLDPTIPHLKGNWHLNDALVTNDVLGHAERADMTGVSQLATDLALDDTAFPYHLEQPGLQWPYSGTWTVRGEDAISSAPVLSDDSGVCFGTPGAVYGVNTSDGSRRWSLGVVGAASPPAAFGSAFYVLTQERGLIAIDAHSGAFAEVDGFQQAQVPAGAVTLVAPAHDGRLLAVAMPDGSLWIKDTAAVGSPPATRFATAPGPASLVVAGGRVYCATHDESGQTRLFVVDPASASISSVEVSSSVFAVAGERVFAVQQGQVTLSDARSIDRITRSSQVMPAGAVTGLAVDADADILVATTDQGVVCGLSCATLGQRWATPIPDGQARTPRAMSGYLNSPTLDGRDVFCTTRSGTVAAVDSRTGQLRGLFFENAAVVTPPVVERGTAYFGCDDAPASAPLDGGLHSVVFGQSYALRCGLDPLDRVDAQNGYARIERAESSGALLFRDPTQMCVEGWVNTRQGGQVLSLCPSTATGMGLGLSVDSDGGVTFSLLRSDSDGWSGVTARADLARVGDGTWHHIAATHQSGSLVRIYVDGVACSVAQQDVSSPPASVVPGLLACVGADASQGAPGNFFVGLIGEIRLWDTYLLASEIHDRMHTKLRGDEPDLLAYWNFDGLAVHDASRNGYDGRLAPESSDATFWLTDLVFEQPSYPYFITQARIAQVGDRGATAGDPAAETRYELTIGVRRADGSPLPGQKLECWYVRHPDLLEPATIEVATSATGDRQVLNGIAPTAAEILAHDSFSMLTDASGSATIQVITSDLDHGPSLDVRADFMPPNERYHVNVLLDNQKLARPAPPSLIAQSKLIQDYHWSPGAVINADRSRRTYRTIVTAVNADRSPRVRERLELRATDRLDIEVDGRVWGIGPYNSQAFYTDGEGELTIVLAADALSVPRLSIWAGFMDRGARYMVDPAEDAHAGLASLDEQRLVDDQRMTNWRTAAEGGPSRQSLLKPEYKPHAAEIASTVRHVMALTQSGPPAAPSTAAAPAAAIAPSTAAAPATGDMPLGLSDAPRPAFPDMLQPLALPRTDVVRAAPTLQHISRGGPVTPENVRASLEQAAPGSLGVAINFGADAAGFSVQHLASASEVAAAMGTPGPVQPASDLQLGNIFGDIWDGLKHGGSYILDGLEGGIDEIKHIAISVGEAITVAIHTVENVFHFVINAIEDAVDVVVTFLKKIALEIWEIIEFLMLLFDWEAIVAAHRIIKNVLMVCIDRLESEASKLEQAAEQAIGSLGAMLGVPIDAGAPTLAMSPADLIGGHAPSAVAASVQGVGSKLVQAKVKEHGGDATLGAAPPAGNSDEDVDLADSLTAAGEGLLADLIAAVPQLAGANIGQLGSVVLDLLKKLAQDVAGDVLSLAIKAVGTVAGLVRAIFDSLSASIDIPFLSQLYRWITGDDLSLLDLLCLALGATVHIAYGLVKGRRFSDDAADLVQTMTSELASAQPLGLDLADIPLELTPPALAPVWGPGGDGILRETFAVMMRAIHTAAKFLTDALFLPAQALYPTPIGTGMVAARAFFTLIKSVTGVVFETFEFLFGLPFYLQQIATDLEQQGIHDALGWAKDEATAAYVLAIVSDVIPLYGAWKSRAGKLASYLGDGMPLSFVDKNEYRFFVVCIFGRLGFIIWQIINMATRRQFSEAVGEHVFMPSRLMTVGDMLKHLAKSFNVVFTRPFVEKYPNPYLYAGVTALRLGCMTTNITLYSIAEFEYVRLPAI